MMRHHSALETGSVSLRTAARLMGVSYATAKRARAVHRRGSPALCAAVMAGRLTVGAAILLIDLPADMQTAVVSWPPTRRNRLLGDLRQLETTS